RDFHVTGVQTCALPISVLEESRASERAEIVGQLQEGEIREGVVKNITDYGAFVDLGGIDGLLHVTDMSWKRVSHPSQVLNVGDKIGRASCRERAQNAGM